MNLVRHYNKRGLWVVIVWEIWKQRNKIAFNDAIVDEVEVFFLAQLKG